MNDVPRSPRKKSGDKKSPGAKSADKKSPGAKAADTKSTDTKAPDTKTTDKGIAARRLSCEVLIKIESEKQFIGPALKAAFLRKKLSERDRAFVTALTQGVLRNRDQLDFSIAELSTQKLEKMPATLRNVLRVAFFQLQHMSDIPEQAVVATSCRLASIMGHKGHVGFTNGILRSYLRKSKENVDVTEVETDDPKVLARKYSMPLWLVEKWFSTFGIDETKRLLVEVQKPPKLTLRVCQQAITPDGLKTILEGRGLKVHEGELAPGCLVIDDKGTFKGSVEKLPGFEDGLFAVQDEAAAFVSVVVDPKPGERILDMCAAPGGKTLHLAEIMEGKGQVVAVDKSTSRLDLLRENRARLGLTNVEVVAANGLDYENAQLFDRILLDAPCTGTGVISRRSDLRFNRQSPDLESLSSLQRKLMEKAATLLKPGGVLVYSTCSIEPEENIDNLKWFCETHPDFQGESLEPFLSPALIAKWSSQDKQIKSDLAGGFIQLIPSKHSQAGFFVCRLRKI